MAIKWPVKLGGGRGLLVYGAFIDTYGNKVRVQTSSSAEQECVWVFCKDQNDRHETPHLNVTGAKKLRAALDRWIKTVERRKK